MERTPHFALRLALLDALALIVVVLATAKGYVEFSQTFLVDIEQQRNNRNSRRLRLVGQLANFTAVQQKLAFAQRSVVAKRAKSIFSYVHILHPYLAALHQAVRIGQSRLASANTLYLSAIKHQSRRETLQNVIVKLRTAILNLNGL